MTIIHELTPEQLKELIQPCGINAERFGSIIVPMAWFCHIHQISTATLRRWIGAGLVEPEPRDNPKGDYKFRLSYVLEFKPESIKGKKYSSKNFKTV